MHLLLREQHNIEAQDVAEDLDHPAAPLLLMSFTDSDLLGLSAAARAQSAEGEGALRLVNLQRLRHPMSVDLYLEKTAAGARVIVVRLLGGLEYWRYGVEELMALCRARKIPLALLPGACQGTDTLREKSTVSPEIWSRLNGFFQEGGQRNWSGAYHLMRSLAGLAEDDGASAESLPSCGIYRTAAAKSDAGHAGGTPRKAWVIFYRAHLAAGDLEGIDALIAALAAAGLDVKALFVASLKNDAVAAWLAQMMDSTPPNIILNATFFSARREGGRDDPSEDGSILDRAEVPVIQLLQPGATRAQWMKAARGLSQSDIAMQIALPELDGRLDGPPISFRKEAPPGLPSRREAFPDGVAQAVSMAEGWTRLAATPPAQRQLALILSDYPGAEGQMAHAVGLDGFASIASILQLLAESSYDTCSDDPIAIAGQITRAQPIPILSAAEYQRLFMTLPHQVREAVTAVWGAPGRAISARFHLYGKVRVAVQPRRSQVRDHKAHYHDPDAVPNHDYLGFYLWLHHVESPHAMIHLGTHGTMEWLPGKAVALSRACLPQSLCQGLPVIYPFIVNNPGEAAAAKRRLGAVTIGHMTPPMRKAGHDHHLAALERLIDEYAEAEGMDRRRGKTLRRDIILKAQFCGLWDECRLSDTQLNDDEALARLDAWLCDVKDLQIRDGLHIFGQTPPGEKLLTATIASSCHTDADKVAERVAQCPSSERRALLAALDGRFIAPGPSGAPTRGRLDVLPTGRNLTTLDPRHLPTRAACDLACQTSRDLLTRHLQEEGRHLRQMVLDVWGSATFRTGGEDMALAFALMGVVPRWADESGRVEGFEVTPLALLDRPRVDVTLRVSGMFRDGFPGLIALFNQAVAALSQREEPADWNGLVAASAPLRVFGAAPQHYGAGVEALLSHWDGADVAQIGAAYLAASSWAYKDEGAEAESAAFQSQLRQSELILHVQDHAETDLLETPDWAAHEGGLAAAAAVSGGQPRLWHGDTGDGQKMRLRRLEDEIARITRGRLTNPDWITAMQRHHYRGAAEIARAVAALCGFAVTLPSEFNTQFDLVFAATLGDTQCDQFLRDANPEAREDIRQRLEMMWRHGKWKPRSNSVALTLAP